MNVPTFGAGWQVRADLRFPDGAGSFDLQRRVRTPFESAAPGADPLGRAMVAYHFDHYSAARARVRCSVAPDDWLHAAYLFRSAAELPELEQQALARTYGRVLDVGAGGGAHALLLVGRGLPVTALDASVGACRVLADRGLTDVRCQDLWAPLPAAETWDTVLLLMNGLGLPGTIAGLQRYLRQLRPHLAPGGQLLATSADVAYLYEDPADGSLRLPMGSTYYGEIQYQMSYQQEVGEPFPWLFLNPALLVDYAAEAGYHAEILAADDSDQYLARLVPNA
ncbi:MAG: class I SAM-dependent methyltransferase [Hymenobacteraceae bacterium]|nr:class I SAM-dependent methyltransferase [Hymenobacteraceae bacterium]